jgi:hypothetical protein
MAEPIANDTVGLADLLEWGEPIEIAFYTDHAIKAELIAKMRAQAGPREVHEVRRGDEALSLVDRDALVLIEPENEEEAVRFFDHNRDHFVDVKARFLLLLLRGGSGQRALKDALSLASFAREASFDVLPRPRRDEVQPVPEQRHGLDPKVPPMEATVLAPKLHRIRVEKFRRISDVIELDLRTPRGRPSAQAVLAGPNGCGKTSALEAVLLGLGQEALIVRDLDPLESEASWRASVPEGARIELTIAFDDGVEETWVRTHDRFFRVKGDGSEESFEQGSASVLPSLHVEYFSSWRAPKLVGPVRALALGKPPANNETNRLWRLKQRIADEGLRQGLQRSAHGDAPNKVDAWMERLNRAWRRFHRNDGTAIAPELVELKEGNAMELVVKRGDDRICSVDQLSSGEIEVLVLAQWVILNDVHAGLLVIDEPELHLHPSWQATILPALRELAPGLQLLVATHSDAVWDQTSKRFLLVDESDPRSQAWRDAHPLPADAEAAS